jgi:ParB family chromosome partitioning protein
MNAKTSFPAPTLSPDVEAIALERLDVSPLNPRQSGDPEGEALLAKSLVACGQVQNLVGLRDPDGRVGIVAGGRRLRALTLAVQERADLSPVMVLIARDEQTALRMASAENSARAQMDPADEIRAFDTMRKTGATVTEIACAFGVTEAQVYRRLRLASLPAPVLDALKSRQITLDQAQAFTLSEDEAKTLELLNRVTGRGGSWSAHSIRQQLTSGAVSATSRKAVFVGETDYLARGGSMTRDLFADTVFFDNAELVNELFAAKLAKAAEQEAAKGWAWVETSDDSYYSDYNTPYVKLRFSPVPLTGEQEARLEELSSRVDEDGELSEDDEKEYRQIEAMAVRDTATGEEMAMSGIVLLVNEKGELDRRGPYIRAGEAQAAVDAGLLAYLPHRMKTADDAKPRSPFSQAVSADLQAIRLQAFQQKLRKNQRMALALMAFSLSDDSGRGSLFGFHVNLPRNVPGDAEGLSVDPMLVQPAGRVHHVGDIEEAFADFCQKTEAEILETLVGCAVRTIHTGFGSPHSAGDLYRSMRKALDVEVRDIWTPTKAAFWGRMPGTYLDAVFAGLAGLDEASDVLRAFRKAKKGEKAEQMEKLFCDPDYQAALSLTETQIAAIADWMPNDTE